MIPEPPSLTTVPEGAFVEKVGSGSGIRNFFVKGGLDVGYSH